MKKLFTILVAVLLTASVFAQAPQKMSYQAVIRDVSDNLITETEIGMQISILQGSTSGTTVYVETQTPTTNANGLVSLEIGAGTVVSGTFATIDWANGPYFIKTETDPAGSTSYSITGTSQLLSVPYALHAKTAETVPTGTQTGQMQYWNGTAWVTVAVTENEGATLQMIGGVPTWIGGTPPNVTNPTTGRIWMDRNLGALQVATSSKDADAYGDFYQWGRAADGHQKRTAGVIYNVLSPTDTPGHDKFITSSSEHRDWRITLNNDLWQGVNGTNNPCPDGYRLPTEAEWEAELASWSTNNAAGALNSSLKLPVGGFRTDAGGSSSNLGYTAHYWSSTVDGVGARSLNFASNLARVVTYRRACGFSVRCIKD